MVSRSPGLITGPRLSRDKTCLLGRRTCKTSALLPGEAGTMAFENTFGAGTPEGVVTAPVGSTYQRTDGGAGTSFYVKESGTGNNGWVAK